MNTVKNYILTLNLFRSNRNEEEVTDHQLESNLIATRVYLITLVMVLLGIGLATKLKIETKTLVIDQPTQSQFESLVDPSCPCSKSSLPYSEFISHEPLFHQVCSSDFISNQWIESFYFGNITTNYLASDYRAIASAFSQALKSFCQLSKEKVAESLLLFETTSMINTYALSQSILESEVQSTIDRFQRTAPNQFRTQVELINQIILVNELLNGLETCLFPSLRAGDVGFRVQLNINGFQHNNESWCWCLESFICEEPSGIYNEYAIDTKGYISLDYKPIMSVPGIMTGLMPVNTLLQSSLECFFNEICLHRILQYSKTPNAKFNVMTPLATSRFNVNSTVQSIIDRLMVEDWGSMISFEKYYTQCAPIMCRYSINERPDYFTVSSRLIGLLGGLCTVLSIIVPLIVNFIRRRPTDEITEAISMRERICRLVLSVKKNLVELNLFNDNSDNERFISDQRIATRIYILILLIVLIILTFYSSLSREVHRETIQKPTQSEYGYLLSIYSSTLECPCSLISIQRNTFMEMEPEYHQVCSSDFVSSVWIDYTNQGIAAGEYFYYLDYKGNAGAQFQLLAIFCQQAKQIITDALQLFLQDDIVTSQVLSPELFSLQMNGLIRDWQLETIKSFNRTFQLIQTTQQGNQLINAYFNFKLNFSDTGEIIPYPLTYFDDQTNSTCNCAISKSCGTLMAFYDFDPFTYNFTRLDTIPNFYTSCIPVQALLDSSLECFYNQTCMNKIALYLPLGNSSFTIMNSSKNQNNERIELIINRLFVDKWSSNLSFYNYYQVCSPQTCTFEYTRQHDFLFLITTVISVFGGLTIGLTIMISILLEIVQKLRSNRSFFDHIDAMKQWTLSLMKEKYLPNRLKLLLLVIILVVLFLFSSFQLETKTIQIFKPSIEIYENLFKKYPNTLQCPCSKVSISYEVLINVSVINYHQVCRSSFISNQWIEAIFSDKNFTQFDLMDFRSTSSAFFQLLASLCQLSKETVNDGLSQLKATKFINAHILSRVTFNDQIQSFINQFQVSMTNAFLNTLHLVRQITNDNTLMTLRGTNWQWKKMTNDTFRADATVRTKPTHYGTCDCGLSSQCVQPAVVAKNNTIPGLYVGCYPLEALLTSSLQCFLDSSCFQQIQLQNTSFNPLDSYIASRFPQNASVETLINQLMVEEWSKSIFYEKYFNECYPLSCTYSYFQHRGSIDVLTNIIGLYGGLVISVKVIVHILLNAYKSSKRRSNRVEPISN
ncbi:unnamed protein product [Adineta ricciae]|uniref:Uncharacterized protein n=1 Tax=Adineta ricciae TaxID=249248 RepID=A0A815C6D4_ADIRI|nr:unnamed protein product [Adineta ricciae]CAF1278731.1 unnamed protein product [Adineta ricciae]